jgi:hypothetical protein
MIAQNPAAAGHPAAKLRPEAPAEAPHPIAGEDQPAGEEDFGALLAVAATRPHARPSVKVEPEADPAPGDDRAVLAPLAVPSPAAEMVAPPTAPTPPEPSTTDTASPVASPIVPSQPLAKAVTLANAAPPASEDATTVDPDRSATIASEIPEPKVPRTPPSATVMPPLVAVRSGRENGATLPDPGAAPMEIPAPRALRPGPAATETSRPPAPAGAPPASPAMSLGLQPEAPAGWHLARSSEHPPAELARPAASTVSPSPSATVSQIAVAVASASEHRVEIRLDPPELGRVQIHLTPVDGGVQAVVLADRPETQDLLRRHAHALTQELGDAGFGNVSLDFHAGQHAAPDPGLNRPPPAVEAIALASPGSTTSTPTERRAPVAGSLDVRL